MHVLPRGPAALERILATSYFTGYKLVSCASAEPCKSKAGWLVRHLLSLMHLHEPPANAAKCGALLMICRFHAQHGWIIISPMCLRLCVLLYLYVWIYSCTQGTPGCTVVPARRTGWPRARKIVRCQIAMTTGGADLDMRYRYVVSCMAHGRTGKSMRLGQYGTAFRSCKPMQRPPLPQPPCAV